jgi:hypothetical protein
MRIIKLETNGVRGLRDASWTLEPDRSGPGHATVVTGPPQVGLTTFLDAIAMRAARLAVTGMPPGAAEVLRVGGKAATIRSTWWIDAEERAFGGTHEETLDAEVVFKRDELARADADPALLGLMSRYDHSPTLSKVVSIPTRRLSDGGFPAFLDFEVDQQFKHLTDDPEKFAGVPLALARHALGLGDSARFEGVQRLFAELCPSVRLVGANRTTMLLEFALSSGLRLPLKRLSFAERNAFILAAVPALYGLQRSVVLLDTPELGLAPGVAARWVDALRRYAPEAQWIIASRDPEVVASVEPASRIQLERRAA